jgi:filamentous hemagglutinin family protein
MKRHASMNRIYRLVWSQVRNAWIAVSENAKGQGKLARGNSKLRRKALVTALSFAFTPMAYAGPIGGQVVLGAGSITQSGAITTIQQMSQNLSLNWQSFNLTQQETVNFQQSSAAAIAVNHILDTNGSQILGQINANGQVWLINPNGILFGKSAQVNVGGLVASTLSLSNTDSPSGSYTFGTPLPQARGTVTNQGTINAANGGYVALLGNNVSNQGTVTAPLGTVVLGAGSATTLTFAGNSLVHLQIDQSTLNNLAENGGLIQADGGQVILNAGAKDAVLASVVNNTGIIEARTVENHAGTIILLGGMQSGTVNVGGTLDASAPVRGNGGFVETSAAHVKVADGTKITTAAQNGLTGTWLIDPVDFTIAASGGDLTGALLSSSLASGNVSILSSHGATGTAGNINVNDVVTWSANLLTLNAQNNININANLNGSGTASLAFQYGQGAVAAGNGSDYYLNNSAKIYLPAGNNFSTQLGSNGAIVNYRVITSLGKAADATIAPAIMTLQGIAVGMVDFESTSLSDNYVLGGDIDAATASTWNSKAGFSPIGDSTSFFTGIFDGLGHTISNLPIKLPLASNVGLFGYVDVNAQIRNLGLIGGSVSGSTYVGGLAGQNYGTVSNCYAKNMVVAGDSNYIGGLLGSNGGLVNRSYANGSVNGVHSDDVGGLVGYNNQGTITDSYATVNVNQGVTPGSSVGGLVGTNDSGTITNSYATGSVNGSADVGGLVGNNSYGTINNSYSTGSLSGINIVGGLVGINYGTGSISHSYAESNMNATSNCVGGLVGINYGTIADSHATGGISGSGIVGGLVGVNYDTGTITRSSSGGNVNGTGNYLGGLAGQNYGSINSSNATGGVTGGDNSASVYLGGLAGANNGTINNSYATGNVNGGSFAYGVTGSLGGLVGYNDSKGIISGSHATGVVSGGGGISSNSIGGLVGANYGTVTKSYARTGSVNGTDAIGGLIGSNYGTVNNSYATLSVSGSSNVGGLVGLSGNGIDPASISDSYATGSVTGVDFVGGLVGYNVSAISNSYAAGTVSGSTNSGALVGGNDGTISNSFWNKGVLATGIGSENGSTLASSGLSTIQMQVLANFTSATPGNGSVNPSWDFSSTWVMNEGSTYPLLRTLMTPLTVTAYNTAISFNGRPFSGGGGVAYSLPGITILGTLSYTGSAQGAVNAGSYTITPAGLYLPDLQQDGYVINFSSGTLMIYPAMQAAIASNANQKTSLPQSQVIAQQLPNNLANLIPTVKVSYFIMNAQNEDKYSLQAPRISYPEGRDLLTVVDSGVKLPEEKWDDN